MIVRLRPLLFVIALAGFAAPAAAQIKGITNRVKRAVEDEVGKKAEQVARSSVRCALGDEACAEKARKEGKTAVFTDTEGKIVVDANGDPVTDAKDAARAAEKPGSEVWRNYDYVPGNTVWFALDLTKEPVGRFPAR
ncbi:MAG: hypothetical protein AB7L66_11310, partial [Gemmatimonadales bacterium]